MPTMTDNLTHAEAPDDRGLFRVSCAASTGHCCWLGKQGVCRFLRDDGPAADRRWVCTLRERLGSWEAVHESPEYIEFVQPFWTARGGGACGDWPGPGESCAECGVSNG